MCGGALLYQHGLDMRSILFLVLFLFPFTNGDCQVVVGYKVTTQSQQDSTIYEPSTDTLNLYHVTASASGSGDGSYHNPWTLEQANDNLMAGDTAYIHGGVYTTQLAPVHSGSAGNPIVYRNFASDVCSLRVSSGYVCEVSSKDYINIQGIRFQKAPYSSGGVTYIENSNHIAFINCRFYGGSTYNNDASYGAWIANEFHNVKYLRVIGCLGDRQDANITGDDYRGECFEVNGTGSKYCIFESDTATNTSHYGFSMPTGTGSSDAFIIVRNCVSYNNHCGGGNNYTNRRVMYEGNRFFRTGQINTYKDGQSLEVIGSYGIYRYNMMYEDGPASAALMGETVNNLILSGSGARSVSNMLYGNAFMGNSLNNKIVYALSFYNDANDTQFGQNIKNNIIAYPNHHAASTAYFWQNQMSGFQAMDTVGSNAFWSHEVGDTIATLNNSTGDHFYTLAGMKSSFSGLWDSGNIECTPGWSDSTTTGMSRDFTLSAGSHLIDAGEALTTVASDVVLSNIVTVGNANYFHYDWGPYDRGDSVLIGNNRCELDSVDYTNRRLILKEAIYASAGYNVHVLATYSTRTAAYTRRVYGSAPDIGPYERPQ